MTRPTQIALVALIAVAALAAFLSRDTGPRDGGDLSASADEVAYPPGDGGAGPPPVDEAEAPAEPAQAEAGETEAAATDVWQVYDDTDGEDLAFTMCTRVAYADAGGEVLYAYYRDVSVDRHGRLTRVGVETRVVIDTPEACA